MRIYLAGEFPCRAEQKGSVTQEIIEEQPQNDMICFLAGCVSRPFAVEQETMRCYIAGPHPDEAMKVSLAESGSCYKAYTEPAGALRQRISILESFYYIKDWMIPYIQNYWNFLLDSGAFTFITGKKDGKSIDWNDYTDRYIEFIKEQDINLFFEMDIDVVVGLKEVERLRKRIEAKTGKQPIPVWHKSRGKDYFIQMCKDYPYVALGGIAAKELTRKEHTFFPWFIDKAHEHKAKIHGLGYTHLTGLRKYHFDSVDSTSWIYGNMSGKIYLFNGKTITSKDKQHGQRIEPRKGAIHNFREWVKFQQYAEVHL